MIVFRMLPKILNPVFFCCSHLQNSIRSVENLTTQKLVPYRNEKKCLLLFSFSESFSLDSLTFFNTSRAWRFSTLIILEVFFENASLFFLLQPSFSFFCLNCSHLLFLTKIQQFPLFKKNYGRKSSCTFSFKISRCSCSWQISNKI